MLVITYAFWGASTILLFWASFVKVQRQLGIDTGQGKSFGMVDAGRGLIAAVLASSSVYLLDWFLEVDADVASKAHFTDALQWIIGIFSLVTILSALLVWWLLEDGDSEVSTTRLSLKGVRQAMTNRSIWQQAIIVMCAYVGYKCTDDFSLYAKDTFQYNDVEAARLAAITFWARPVAAVVSGLMADRWVTSKVVIWCFFITIIGSVLISLGVFQIGAEVMVLITVTSTGAAIYGLRGIYFALFEESQVPMYLTGSGAGLVSLVGYTPDVFMGPLMGIILDHNPGAIGHQYLFAVLAGFSVVGLLTSFAFRQRARTL